MTANPKELSEEEREACQKVKKEKEAMKYIHRIYARNCVVREIGRAQAEAFLEANHRLGFTRCRHLYGLFLEHGSQDSVPQGTLVAVSGFSSPRIWKKGERTVKSYEWVRYASLRDCGICGGMSKMLKAFIEEVHPDDVMSYADATWSNGEVYRKLGFTEEEAKIFPDGSKSLKFRLKLTEYE